MNEYVFSDLLLTATELNRKPGWVLDMAREQPVTITRNDESFALMPRPLAKKLMSRWQDALLAADLFKAVLQSRDNTLASENAYHWVGIFDPDEQSELVNEVIAAMHDDGSQAGTDGTTSVAAIIHEWRESAKAIDNKEHGKAFSCRIHEKSVRLSDPSKSEPQS